MHNMQTRFVDTWLYFATWVALLYIRTYPNAVLKRHRKKVAAHAFTRPISNNHSTNYIRCKCGLRCIFVILPYLLIPARIRDLDSLTCRIERKIPSKFNRNETEEKSIGILLLVDSYFDAQMHVEHVDGIICSDRVNQFQLLVLEWNGLWTQWRLCGGNCPSPFVSELH